MRSGSSGRGVLEINMRVAAAVLLAGLRHTGYDEFGKIASMHVLPPRTLTSLAPRVWEAAKTVALRKMSASPSSKCLVNDPIVDGWFVVAATRSESPLLRHT